MRHHAFALVEMLTVVAALAILAAILVPLMTPDHGCSQWRSTCQSNLKEIALGLTSYVQDSDERYPLAAFPAGTALFGPDRCYGWADAGQFYIRNAQVFHCPAREVKTPNLTDPTVAGYTDYWLNLKLSGVDDRKVRQPTTTFLLGEGNDGADGSDARYSRDLLPRAWRSAAKAPARRHQHGGNYAFADGHVKWLKPETVTNDPVRSGHFTFAMT